MKARNERNLDRTNLRILEHLARAGRTTYSDLASHLGCSINTVRDRIFALERRGVIRGYEAIVDEAELGRPVHAMVFLEANATARRPSWDALRLAGVRRAHLTTGRHTLVLEMTASSLDDIEAGVRTHLEPAGFHNPRVVLLGGPAANIESATRMPEVAR